MKILWLTNIPSPYRVRFFNELGKYCDLTVLFEKKASTERDESWKSFNSENFNAIFLRGMSVGVAEAFCPCIVRYLNRRYDHIVITNFSDPTGILAILMLKMKHMAYEIESDGAFPGTGKGIKELLKRFLLSGAVKYFSTAQLHDDYYRLYGAQDIQLVRYPFTSIYACDILDQPVSGGQKSIIRQKIGVKEKYMVLAVGQFIYRKGFDVLIKAAKYLDDKYGIYIIGGRAPIEYQSLVERLKLSNVHFVDFKKSSELDVYYKGADVFVHPTREDIWGLVINEAMAKGLPIVTTDKCIAGLELIESGINGYIIACDREQELADRIKKCMKHENMAIESLKKIQAYTVEKMVEKHMEAWQLD